MVGLSNVVAGGAEPPARAMCGVVSHPGMVLLDILPFAEAGALSPQLVPHPAPLCPEGPPAPEQGFRAASELVSAPR